MPRTVRLLTLFTLLLLPLGCGSKDTTKTEDEPKPPPAGPDAPARRDPSRTPDPRPNPGGITAGKSAVTKGRWSPEVGDAAQEIKKLGGQLILEDKDTPESPIIGVRFNNIGITGDRLGPLTKIPTLREVRLTLCYRLTDISAVAEISELRVLSLEKSGQIKDAALEPLTRLRKLEELTLPYSVTDDGLRVVAGIPSLNRLDLAGSTDKITDAGMAHVARLPSLTHLTICQKIGDAGLAKLAGHPKLESLDCSRGHTITDAGLRHLATIPGLRELDLSGCQKMTAEGVDSLSGCKSLKKLRLPPSNRQIGDQSVIRLKKALPGLEVSR